VAVTFCSGRAAPGVNQSDRPGHQVVGRPWPFSPISPPHGAAGAHATATSQAVAHGIRTTAGVVTSAAIIMVAVFAVFGTLSLQQFKLVAQQADLSGRWRPHRYSHQCGRPAS